MVDGDRVVGAGEDADGGGEGERYDVAAWSEEDEVGSSVRVGGYGDAGGAVEGDEGGLGGGPGGDSDVELEGGCCGYGVVEDVVEGVVC